MPRIDDLLGPVVGEARKGAREAPDSPSLPFEAVLVSTAQPAVSAVTPGTRHAAARRQADTPPEGLRLVFETSCKTSNASGPANSAARVSAGQAAQKGAKALPQGGNNPVATRATETQTPASGVKGRLVEASAWEKSQQAKKSAARVLPGRGDSQPPVAATLRHLAEKGISLDARGVSVRADGTPIVRDAEGTARVLRPQDPEKSLGAWLHDEAEDPEVERVAREALRRAEKTQPARTPETYARRSEQVRAEAPVKLAEQIRRDIHDPSRLEVARPAATTQGAARETEPASDAAPRVHTEAERLGRSARRSGSGQQSDSQQHPSHRESRPEGPVRESPAGAERGGDVAARAATRKSAPSSGVSPTTREPGGEAALAAAKVDAAPVYAALQQGARADAASRMAALLHARVDYLLTQERPELRLELSPRDMGDIRIRLIANGDNHVMRIQADREATARVIELAAPQLVQQLQKVGVQVSQVAVDYGSTDFTQTGHGGQADTAGQDGQGPGGLFPDAALSDPPADEPSRLVTTHDGQLDVLA